MPQEPKASERQARTPLPREDGDKKPSLLRTPRMRIVLVVAALLAANYIFVALFAPGKVEPVKIPYSPVFLDQVRAGNVERVSSTGATVDGRFKKEFKYGEAEASKDFATEFPIFANDEELNGLLEDNKVVIEAEPINQSRGFLASLILGFGPVILLIALFFFIFRRSSGGPMNALGAFGRSKARRVEGGEQKITFADVAGIDEAKSVLSEIVDFLKNPERYQKLGGRIPKGVLLSGRPGTGKTLLARAVAGEADAPFFSISASEFVEAIVGIGASRVRDLFKQAKEASPAIIFIDELDAIGRSRGTSAGFGGGNDEREQTLNQILTEMDGFESNVAVIVLGATNRPEILDAALLRPGRFDRRVAVPSPDREGRSKILAVHTRSLPLADDVNLDRLAATTPGMVGADLANLANEAALMAARLRHEKVEMADFTDALEKIVLGAPRGTVLSPEDRKRVAYHEAGHALVGMLTPGADPVRKVSIIPRGQALGVTMSLPTEDRFMMSRGELMAQLAMMLGGRAAERVTFDEITTGASNDLERVTQTARQMVTRYGMSEKLGPMALGHQQGQVFMGRDFNNQPDYSDEIAFQIDKEIRRIVDESYDTAEDLLIRNRELVNKLSADLIEYETVDAKHLMRLVEEYAVDNVSPNGAIPDADGRQRNRFLD